MIFHPSTLRRASFVISVFIKKHFSSIDFAIKGAAFNFKKKKKQWRYDIKIHWTNISLRKPLCILEGGNGASPNIQPRSLFLGASDWFTNMRWQLGERYLCSLCQHITAELKSLGSRTPKSKLIPCQKHIIMCYSASHMHFLPLWWNK